MQIRFVRGTGWDSKVIEWGSRSWTSHVELYFPTTPETRADRTFGAQLDGGVKWRYTSDPCYAKTRRTETWEHFLNYDQCRRVEDVMAATSGRPYDWRAIVSFAFGERDWRETDSWFCSEFVALVLEKTNLVKFPANIPSDRITPRDIYLLFTGLPGSKFSSGTFNH